MRPLNFLPGESIFSEGDHSREVFFLLKGTVECSCVDPKVVLQSFSASLAPPEVLNALQHLREDLLLQSPLFSPLHSPPAPVPPLHRSSPTSDSESSDGEESAIPFDDTADDIFLPRTRLFRAPSFRLPSVTEISMPSDPVAAEFLLSGVTYSTLVPMSATRYITRALKPSHSFCKSYPLANTPHPTHLVTPPHLAYQQMHILKAITLDRRAYFWAKRKRVLTLAVLRNLATYW